MTALKRMLHWGVDQNIIGSDPLAKLKLLPHENAKNGRPLMDDEVKRLLAASRQPYRDIFYTYLVTGLRKSELASLTFADIDWENRELIVRASRAKNHRERRIPIEAGLWEILLRLEKESHSRKPPGACGGRSAEHMRKLFSKENVFVTGKNTRIAFKSQSIYVVFMHACKRARIETKRLDSQGKMIDHVDLHSLRRTFATNLISNGADPKSVQELLGHATLEMTMLVYTKIHGHTKRSALGRLSYGQGANAPEHLLQYPKTTAPEMVRQPPETVTNTVTKSPREKVI